MIVKPIAAPSKTSATVQPIACTKEDIGDFSNSRSYQPSHRWLFNLSQLPTKPQVTVQPIAAINHDIDDFSQSQVPTSSWLLNPNAGTNQDIADCSTNSRYHQRHQWLINQSHIHTKTSVTVQLIADTNRNWSVTDRPNTNINQDIGNCSTNCTYQQRHRWLFNQSQ